MFWRVSACYEPTRRTRLSTISMRIAAAMLPALILLLTLFGVATALREGEVLAAEMQRDADAVAAVAAALLADESLEGDVGARLASLDIPRVDIAILPSDPGLPETDAVRGIAPIAGSDGAVRGYVVVTEPLADRDAFVKRALVTDALGVLVSTVVAGAVALGVGRTLVQARVLRIMDRLEQVARDRFDGEPLQLGVDELGQLGDAVESMSRELQSTRARAEEELAARRRAQLHLRRADRLALVGRTVAVFAHEVGNPLAVIVGRAGRIARRQPEAASDAGIVLAQAERIETFVRRLLDYSRHDDAFELVPTAITPLVGEAVALVEERTRKRGVRIRRAQPAAEVFADVDAHGMVQVMTNLLANAIDASPDGGEVRVRVAVIGEEPDDQRVEISVEDDGEGIAEPIRSRVLDPFFTTKSAGEGTGLGLSIVAEIISDHGGRLVLDEAPAGGCRAVVHLPAGGALA